MKKKTSILVKGSFKKIPSKQLCNISTYQQVISKNKKILKLSLIFKEIAQPIVSFRMLLVISRFFKPMKKLNKMSLKN